MNSENVNEMLKKHSSRIVKTRDDIMRIYVMTTRISSYLLTGIESNTDLENLIDHCDYCLGFTSEITDELNKMATEIITDFEDVTIDLKKLKI